MAAAFPKDFLHPFLSFLFSSFIISTFIFLPRLPIHFKPITMYTSIHYASHRTTDIDNTLVGLVGCGNGHAFPSRHRQPTKYLRLLLDIMYVVYACRCKRAWYVSVVLIIPFPIRSFTLCVVKYGDYENILVITLAKQQIPHFFSVILLDLRILRLFPIARA